VTSALVSADSAEGWKELLLPEIDRQQRQRKEVAFRADASPSRRSTGLWKTGTKSSWMARCLWKSTAKAAIWSATNGRSVPAALQGLGPIWKSSLVGLDFEEGAMVTSSLDQPMDDARKLRGARAVGLAQQIGIERVGVHVTVELAAQSVLTHLHRDDWSRGDNRVRGEKIDTISERERGGQAQSREIIRG
jgi:hypothetical protein